MNSDKFLTRKEASSFLGELGLPVSKSTLAKMATVGGGPNYRRFGLRAVYTTNDLRDWVQDRLSIRRRSTSENP